MRNPVSSFISFLLLFSTIFLLSPFTEATTYFVYRSSDHESGGISYDGDAFRDDKGVINLNKRKVGGHSVGRAYYSNPIRLWEGSTNVVTNFSTTFTFWVSSPAGKETETSGGMAFFLAADASIPRRSSGSYLGLVSSSSSLDARKSRRFVAVEFDSLAGGPSWDTGESRCHVGINVNSMKSVARTDVDDTICRSGHKGKAEVRYYALARNLTVTLEFDQSPFHLSHVVDLKKSLPEWVYVGFSASTGLTSDLKTISSWKFVSALDSSNDDPINIGLILSIVIPVSVFILLVIAGICIYYFCIRKTNKKDENVQKEEIVQKKPIPEEFEERAPRSIPLKQITAATENFKQEWKLGFGASGEVYRGFLKDLKREVAIKRIFKDSFQREKEFLAEVQIIGSLSHRNLVHLVGWCHEDTERLLVYEFMPNGSLDFHLFNANVLLSGESRYEIAKGVASAIFYLHEGCENCIVHRDIKCSNIMLDQNFAARLGDFGLARLTAHGSSLRSTMMAGTIAYMAPEMLHAGKANRKTDIYSFGIVLLEIACGRKAMDRNEKGKERLDTWLWELYERDAVMEAADKKLPLSDEGKLKRLLLVGLWCSHPLAEHRPSITQVISALNVEMRIPNLSLTNSNKDLLHRIPSLTIASGSSTTTESYDERDSNISSTSQTFPKPSFFR